MDVVNVELVDLKQIRDARVRDPDSGKFADPERAARLSAQYVYLYDPPGPHGIVYDGEGNPMRSYILASNILKALEAGFTEEPPVSEDELRGMKVAELRDLAEERDVDLSGIRRKDEMVDEIAHHDEHKDA